MSREKDRDYSMDFAAQCATIQSFELNEEFISVPKLIEHWNTAYARALGHYLMQKEVTAQVHAQRSRELREEMTSLGGKKPTVAEMTELVTLDPLYQQAVAAENSALVEKTRISGVCEAMLAKRDMLQMLGGKLRTEIEQQVRTMGSTNTSAPVRRFDQTYGPSDGVNDDRIKDDDFGL